MLQGGTTYTIDVITRSPDDTRKLGQRVAACIRKPVIIALSGDLGSGKTVFVQGLAAGLGVPHDQYVTSPSYTLVNQYEGRLPLIHIDLYRLEGMEDMEDIGLSDLFYEDAVVAIEWASKLDQVAPSSRVDIKIDISSEEKRKFRFIPYGRDAIKLVKEIEIQIKEARPSWV